MKILAISDVPAEEPFNIDIPGMGIELVVTLGDVPREFIELVLLKKGSVPYYAVNGDFDNRTVPDYANVHGKVKRLGDIRIAGFEGSVKTDVQKRRHTLPEWRARWKLRSLPTVDLFIAHSPMAGVHDRVDPVHSGFQALREYVEKHPPKVFMHGHVGRNMESTLGDTRVICVTGKRVLELNL
jgi:Icc-related predicted phosphoesterase